jgi:hypothetical protein
MHCYSDDWSSRRPTSSLIASQLSDQLVIALAAGNTHIHNPRLLESNALPVKGSSMSCD